MTIDEIVSSLAEHLADVAGWTESDDRNQAELTAALAVDHLLRLGVLAYAKK